MQPILLLLILLILAELFEAKVQSEQTLLGVVNRLYFYYRRSVFLFFAVHPSFYILLLIIMVSGVLNFTMVSLVVLKMFDMFYKLELIKRVHIQKNFPADMMVLLTQPIPSWFFLLGLFIYPSLVYFALS
jgi:hypothetical protein